MLSEKIEKIRDTVGHLCVMTCFHIGHGYQLHIYPHFPIGHIRHEILLLKIRTVPHGGEFGNLRTNGIVYDRKNLHRLCSGQIHAFQLLLNLSIHIGCNVVMRVLGLAYGSDDSISGILGNGFGSFGIHSIGPPDGQKECEVSRSWDSPRNG